MMFGHPALNRSERCELGFQPRERRTEAEVRTTTKREMPVIPAPEVQDVWTGEFGWVAIGCAERQIEVIAGSNCRLASTATRSR
jgi:hypothetical protein